MPHSALARPDEALVQRTRVIEPFKPEARSALDAETLALSQRLDAVLLEAAQDLGLTVDLSERIQLEGPRAEHGVPAQAADRWLIAPELERARAGFWLRIVAVPPGSRVLYVRTERLVPDELEMRVVLMMRDLMEAPTTRPQAREQAEQKPAEVVARAHSPGTAILALNAALMGGYAGFSVQRASGSDDDRLAYPLVALGAGVGLGGAMLVADEWDIGVGDAWLLSAGMWWPTLSGFLLSESYGVKPRDRFAYGLLGATAGLTLTAGVLGFQQVSEGDAALAHSGAAFGTLLGGLTELAILGKTNQTPQRGLAFGAAAGLLGATTLLTQIELPASRVLFVDLGASLGALTGAAAASPLLLVEEDDDSSNRNRLWLASVAVGTLAGGFLGYHMTRPANLSAPPGVRPTLGLMELGPNGPVLGAGLRGLW